MANKIPTKTSFKKGDSRLTGNKNAQGHIPWNKGKKTGIVPKTVFKKGHKPWHEGKKITEHPAFKGFRKTNNRSSIFRKVLMEEIGKCEKCGFDNPLALIVHHIDKNGRNNERKNLILLCANCHYIEHDGFKKGEKDDKYKFEGR